MKEQLKPDKPLLEVAARTGDIATVRAALPVSAMWERREALESAVLGDQPAIARLLLAAGAWPDHAGRRWGRWGGCLHAALLLGRGVAMLELLLDGGASVGARDGEGHTPLQVAVRTARDDAAALLQRRGAREVDVTATDRLLGECVRGERPSRRVGRPRCSDHQHLSWAARRGHAAAIPSLLAIGLDPNVPDDDGETALHLAVAAGSIEAVEALIAAGARIDTENFRSETPLETALRCFPGDQAIVERLRRAGAKPREPVDLVDLFEEAADAVVDGDLVRLTALLDREPRLVFTRSIRDHRCTLLNYVGANGVEMERQRSPANAPAVAELLLARGADPNAFALTYGGGLGQTTLTLAVTSAFPEQAGVMGDLVRVLVRGGAKLEGPNGDATPLHYARASAHAALVECGAAIDVHAAASLGLLDRVQEFVTPDGSLQPGARLGRPQPTQQIKDEAFLAACAGGHAAVAAYLLDAGARIDAKGSEGMTGLHLAAWRCDFVTARLLLERGAPLEAKNDYRGTVLDFVVWIVRNRPDKRGDWRALVHMLIAAGADVEAARGRDAIEAALRTLES
jgi:ankyrin repeat protein